MGLGFPHSLILLGLLGSVSSFSASHCSAAEVSERIAEGVQYSEFTCITGTQKVQYKSLTRSPSSPYRIRVIDNPTVKPVDKNPYVGEALPSWLEKRPKRSIVGAVNGNFFGTFFARKSKYPGYRSTGLLLSTASRPNLNSPLRVTPLKDWGKPNSVLGGDSLVVSTGTKTIVGNLVPLCSVDGKCKISIDRALAPEFPESLGTPLTPEEFQTRLASEFPKMEYAMQILMPLQEPGRFACKEGGRDAWCQKAARTILCIEPNDSVSLMTAEYALIDEIAQTLGNAKSQCEKKCRHAFNLDGGGSTQMVVRNPTTKQFEMRKGSATPRPVQNFIILEK